MIRSMFQQPRKIFVDCGGHNGSSVRKFRRTIDLKESFEIFTFEPNPEFATSYQHFKRHHLMPYAVWTEDGFADFFLDREDADGSTLMRDKTTRDEGGIGTLDKENPLSVRAINISSWLKRNFRKHDNIFLKLDIEGAEYDVLEKMLADDSISLIDKLFIEWHWFKVGIPEARHNSLVTQIRERGISITEWDAQERQ